MRMKRMLGCWLMDLFWSLIHFLSCGHLMHSFAVTSWDGESISPPWLLQPSNETLWGSVSSTQEQENCIKSQESLYNLLHFAGDTCKPQCSWPHGKQTVKTLMVTVNLGFCIWFLIVVGTEYWYKGWIYWTGANIMSREAVLITLLQIKSSYPS